MSYKIGPFLYYKLVFASPLKITHICLITELKLVYIIKRSLKSCSFPFLSRQRYLQHSLCRGWGYFPVCLLCCWGLSGVEWPDLSPEGQCPAEVTRNVLSHTSAALVIFHLTWSCLYTFPLIRNQGWWASSASTGSASLSCVGCVGCLARRPLLSECCSTTAAGPSSETLWSAAGTHWVRL